MLCQASILDSGIGIRRTGSLSFAATLIVSFEYGPRMSVVTCSLANTRRARDVTRIGLHPAFLIISVSDSRFEAKSDVFMTFSMMKN
jgi:hypothetical protein